jgi:hypothetical protein
MKVSMKRVCLLLGATALAAAPLVAVSASAATKPQVKNVSGTFTDKPYTATTPDSGSCGQNWAIDLFSRSFVVYPKASDGTTTVIEHFNNARFITLGDGDTGSAQSPGACDADSNPDDLLKGGVSGTFSGTFTIVVNSGFTYDPGNGCGSNEGASGAAVDDGCNDAQWVQLAFPGATFNSDTTTTAYSLTYHAIGAGLLGNTWTDSSAGDSGDIYSSTS